MTELPGLFRDSSLNGIRRQGTKPVFRDQRTRTEGQTRTEIQAEIQIERQSMCTERNQGSKISDWSSKD